MLFIYKPIIINYLTIIKSSLIILVLQMPIRFKPLYIITSELTLVEKH